MHLAALTLIAVGLNVISAVLVAIQKFFKYAERVRGAAKADGFLIFFQWDYNGLGNLGPSI